jgi:very-short-patch-repair endonuclease
MGGWRQSASEGGAGRSCGIDAYIGVDRNTTLRQPASGAVDASIAGRQRRVASLAGRQKGNVTRSQLLTCGVPARTVDNWISTGRLVRKHPGVYRLGHDAAPPFADELAAVMACSPRAFLGDASAACLWRMLQLAEPPRPITVLLAGRSLRAKRGIRIRRTRSLLDDETTTHHGIPVTTPARTLLDLAATAPIRTLERAFNETQVQNLTTPAALLPLLARHPRHRGSKALRALIDPAGSKGITRSEAERRLLDLIRASGLPLPRANVKLGPYEVDFLWREQRLVVEVDGFRYHSSRTAFERDRARDAALAARGYRVVRVTWRQLVEEPYAVVARLAQAIGSAA